MNNVLLKLVTESRLLTILYDNLSDTIKASSLYGELSDYLQDYLTENKISAGNAIDTYSKYITAYNQHCKTFIKTNSYPIQNGDYAFTLFREEYDVILLLSTLFSAHRFRIMQLVVEQSKPEQNGLYIGAGSGVEIALTKHNYKEIFAYDLSVNKYLFRKFKDIQLKEELYKGQKINYFNSIYLIELLEHIEDPYGLIKICHGSLTPRGKIF